MIRRELTLGKVCPFKSGLGVIYNNKCTKNCALYIERQINTFGQDDEGNVDLSNVKQELHCGCVLVHNERENNDSASSLNALAQVLCKAFETMNVEATPGRVKEREPTPPHLSQAVE